MADFTAAHRILKDAGMIQGLVDEEVRRRLHLAARAEECDRRILAFYLTDMEDRKIYQDTGHQCTAHYAEAKLDLDRRRTAELIYLGRRLLELPEIDRAFCQQEISWSKSKVLARAASPETQEAWLERARPLSVRELKAEVRRVKPGEAPRKPGDRRALPTRRYKVGANVGVLTHEKLRSAMQKLSAERSADLGFEGFIDAACEMVLSCDEDGNVPGRKRIPGSIYKIACFEDEDGEDGDERLCVETDEGTMPIESCSEHGDAPQSGCIHCDTLHGEIDKKTPDWMREKVRKRDRGRCVCCGSKWCVQVHHIHYRSKGGRTRMRNLITLCAECHGKVHDGLLVLSGKRASKIVFLDAQGEKVNGPDRLPKPGAGLRVGPPSRKGGEPARPPVPETTLSDVPPSIDADWWARHASLIRFTKQGLEFQPGVPLEEAKVEETTRPMLTELDDKAPFEGFLGQHGLIARLGTRAEGSRERGRPFPHTLFTGRPGMGKTKLARGIAAAYGSRLHTVLGSMLADGSRLVSLLAGLEKGDMLFIDEIHAVPRPVLEILYEATAEQRLHLHLRQGNVTRTVQLDLAPFTLLAATTEDGDLPEALMSRFGVCEAIGGYDDLTLAELLERHAVEEGYWLDEAAAARIAACARRTPREALRILDEVLNATAESGIRRVRAASVEWILKSLGYDESGLDRIQRACLAALARCGRAISLKRLARQLGTTARNLEDNVEPELLMRGLMEITERGRVAAHGPRIARA